MHFYVSTDGVNWGSAVASGTFNYGNLSTNCPDQEQGCPRHCRSPSRKLPGNTSAWSPSRSCNGNPWTSAAELNLLGAVSASNPPPSLAQVTVNPTIVVGGSSAQGTVTLSGPAPTGGVVVSLVSSDPSAQVAGQRDCPS